VEASKNVFAETEEKFAATRMLAIFPATKAWLLELLEIMP